MNAQLCEVSNHTVQTHLAEAEVKVGAAGGSNLTGSSSLACHVPKQMLAPALAHSA